MNSNGDILNILFLGGAKRVSFGRKLIAAAESRGIKLRIFSYELDPRVPIALIGDVIIGKKWNDEHVLEDLHKVVAEFNIDVMLPFVDGAVGIAASYISKYGDVWSPVVCPEMAETIK